MPLTRTVTSKAEEKAIKQDNHVQPAGHITVVKNKTDQEGKTSCQLISIGGTRCIHQLYLQSRLHPPTLELESVDASTDSMYRVGGCIHRPMKYGLSYRLSTDCINVDVRQFIALKVHWIQC